MVSLAAINFRKYLLIIGIIVIVVGIILAPYDQFQTNVTSEKVSFTSRNDNLTITGNLYLPQNYTSSQAYPAVVLVHGINDRPERYHHMAVEFVRRNFIALAINLRGHQDSQGICTLSAYEPRDISGAADYLLTNYNITNLGLIGHSLGGMSSIRAAHNDTRFNATMVMGPPISVDILFSRFLADPTIINEIAWLLSLDFNLSDPYEKYIRSPINWVNNSKPKNFFFALGDLDTAATPEEALLLIANHTGNSTVEVNVAYGDFSAGNRSMLKMYEGIDHGSEPGTPAIILDAVLWMENALNVTQGSLTLEDLQNWNSNPYWGNLLSIGFFIFLIPAISYICTSILNPTKVEKPKINDSIESKKKLLSLGMYSGIFIGASALTYPLINLLQYASWSPYNFAGLLANILTIQGIFVGLGLVAIYYYEKRSYNATLVDFGFNKSNTLKAIIIGFAISALMIFGFFFLSNIPTGLISLPRDWGAYLLVFLNFLLVSIVGELYFRGLIQTKLFKEGARLKNWMNILFIAIVGGIIQGVATFFIILPIGNVVITIGTFSISILLIALVGGMIIFSVIGFLNAWIFHKTQHILPGAIIQASLISWFLTSFMVMM